MSPQADTQTILIVDDMPRNLALVVEALETRGYRVAVAQDGEEGLRRARLIQPDLILLDIMLPGADGFEICRRLKDAPETRDIPVIFMTALASTEHKVQGFAAGGVDYVTKPLQLDEVSARVATHLELRAVRRDLEARNAQLDSYRLELERRVDERTAQLSANNRQLREEIEARRVTEERLALKNFALDQVHEAAFLVDEAGRCHYVNHQACRRLGYTEEELLGLGLDGIDPDWSPERRAEDWAKHWAALREQGGITFETRHRTRAGEIFPVEVTANYLEYDGHGYVLGLARDITERKRADRELHLLNVALDQSFDAAYLVDAELRFRYVNEAAARALGYSRDELLALNLLDIDPSVSREAVRGLMRQTAAHGRFPGTIESRHRRKDGSTFPIEVGATTFSYDGEALFLTVVRDITERKAAEQALRASELEYRTLANNLPDNIARYDREGRKRYINPALAKVLGDGARTMLGRTTRENFPDGAFEDYACLVDRALATGEGGELEKTFPGPDGLLTHQIRFLAERDEAGEIVGALVIGRDVSERKRAEAALAAREREYRTLAENLPDNLIRYNREARAVYVNRTFGKTVALDPARYIGRTPSEAYPELGDVRRYQEVLERVIATGEPARIEIAVPGPAGAMRIHEVSFVAERRPDGEIRGALAIGRDITAMKEAERILAESHARLSELAAQREVAREEERKRIAREIHDELGQVLTALKLGISTLKIQFGEDNPALAGRVQSLLKLAERSIQVVRDVAASLRPPLLDMGIGPALEWLVAQFEEHSGVSCRLSLPDAKLDCGEDLAMVLFRVVQEALTNAARHAEAGRVDIEVANRDGFCMLEIRDDGKGYDQDAVDGKRTYGLMGMRERVRSLGGKVAIASAPGRGTRIDVRLPESQPEAGG